PRPPRARMTLGSGPLLQRLGVAQREAVGHSRDVVDHVVHRIAALDEVLEDPPYRRSRARVLDPGPLREVDLLEHEGAQGEHRVADLFGLPDVALARGGLDEVVDERVDATRAGRPEQLDLLAR